MHPCEIIYTIGAQGIRYGETPGTCRITGKEGVGLPFKKWVKDTFTNHDYLKPGDIVCNEALFTFDEASEILKAKTGREKPQRFRTYSHVVCDGQWHVFTKADKREIYTKICAGAELVCLTDSGQKHILFKHKIGFWQLDDLFIQPDVEYFKYLHGTMQTLMEAGFTQSAIINGDYNPNFIIKNGFEVWKENEAKIKEHRGKPMFDFASWMLFINK